MELRKPQHAEMNPWLIVLQRLFGCSGDCFSRLHSRMLAPLNVCATNSKTASHLIPIFIMLIPKALLPTLSRPKPSTPQVSCTRPSQVLVFFCSCHEIQSITTLSITPQARHTPSILHLPTTSFVFQMLVSCIALYTFALSRQSRSYFLVCYDEALAPCCEHLTATEKSLEVYTRVSSIRPPQVLFCKCSCHTIQSVTTFTITPQAFHTTT